MYTPKLIRSSVRLKMRAWIALFTNAFVNKFMTHPSITPTRKMVDLYPSQTIS